jgi:hypothetical protein
MKAELHAVHRVVAFELLGAFTLRLRFEDATEQIIDFSPVLAGDLYGPLAEPLVFAKVRLDPGAGTIVWPNGADFDPALLHDWPAHSSAMEEMARGWPRTHR